MKISRNIQENLKYTYGKGNTKEFLTIHQTGNANVGANADAHSRLQKNLRVGRSWHWQVDDKEAIQSYEHDVKCWHTGDGTRGGNIKSIGIEICINQDGNYIQSVRNGAKLAAKILRQENIPLRKMVQHWNWSGKNCPAEIRAGKQGINWQKFVEMVESELKVLNAANTNANANVDNYNDNYAITINNPIKVYMTADSAKTKTNSVDTYIAGAYYVYKKHNGMINISKTKGRAGAWINPEDINSKVQTIEKWRVLDPSLNIRKEPSSSSTRTGKITNKGIYEISEIKGKWGKLKNGQGWIHSDFVENLSSSLPSISPGDMVYITGTYYANSTTKIPLWVKKSEHKVTKVTDDIALLGYPSGISSWVYLKDLRK